MRWSAPARRHPSGPAAAVNHSTGGSTAKDGHLPMTTIADERTDQQTARAPVARWAAALAGLLAAFAALAGAEVVAGLVTGARSPVTSIGSVVIDLAPPALKDAAIETFGTADKPVLIGGVLVVLAAVAAGIGLLAVRRLWWGVLGVVGLGAVGLAAALADGSTSGIGTVLPSVAAVVVGVAALWWLVSTLHGDVGAVGDGATASTDANDATTDAAAADDPGRSSPHPASRRDFLRASAIVGALAVVAGSAGRWFASRAEATVAAAAARIPPVVNPLPPVPADASVPVEGMPPYITPTSDFYRIDTALQVPTINVDNWTLRIFGMVDTPMELDFNQLLDRYEVVEADITLACVSNEVGGNLVGNARWQGVRLADVLADAGVRDGADQLVGRAVDGFTTGSPLEVVLDGRESLIAVGMNGEQLPREHGFPARLVVPGLYGYVSATKWLGEIELTTFDAFDAYWIPRGWAERGPIKTQSRIDVPRPLATVAPGKVAVAGVAWAPTRGIRAVEVRVDDGPWQRARLGARVDVDTWRQWVYEWDARPGRHELAVRATDGDGEVQTSDRSQPRPDGATGRHSIVVTVSEA